jgi:hypothetical protein
VGFLYAVSKAAIWSPVDINIQEGNLAICLHFHGKLYVGKDAVEVKKEAVQFFQPMGPDHRCVLTHLNQKKDLWVVF